MQEFQAGVEGGVAGRDIVNKAPAFLIAGNVGAALNVKDAGAVHIHVGAAPASNVSELDVNRYVSPLLKTCTDADCRQALEQISMSLFGQKKFKNLNIDQLQTLQRIAEELAKQATATRLQQDEAKAELELVQQERAGLQRQLNEALANLRGSRKSSEEATAQEQQLRQQLVSAQQQIDALRQAKPARPLCQTCSSATANLAKARRGLVTVGGLAMLGLMAASFFSYSTYAANQSLKVAEARLTVCEFAGQSYSVGTVLVREDAPDWRCTNSNGAVAWEEIKTKRKR